MKHLFKICYSILFVVAIAVDLTQMVLYLVAAFSERDPYDLSSFEEMSITSQYLLFAINAMSLKYFFNPNHFWHYAKKTMRHEYTYLFLIIFVIRFAGLLRGRHDVGFYFAKAIYLVGVFLKHLSRLLLLQLLCFYRFRSVTDPESDSAVNVDNDDDDGDDKEIVPNQEEVRCVM
jgi:hypothetical protein